MRALKLTLFVFLCAIGTSMWAQKSTKVVGPKKAIPQQNDKKETTTKPDKKKQQQKPAPAQKDKTKKTEQRPTNKQTQKPVEKPTTGELGISLTQKVDLGLSVYWAGYNIGATSPEEVGDYLAWGETSAKDSYNESNSTTTGKDNIYLYENGIIDMTGLLTPKHDAATVRWGDNWRMPTLNEQLELRDRCQWEWVTFRGMKGQKVTGPNGNAIFLPAGGLIKGTVIEGKNKGGDYWSSSVDGEVNQSWSYYISFDNTPPNKWYRYFRHYGRSVRAVSKK